MRFVPIVRPSIGGESEKNSGRCACAGSGDACKCNRFLSPPRQLFLSLCIHVWPTVRGFMEFSAKTIKSTRHDTEKHATCIRIYTSHLRWTGRCVWSLDPRHKPSDWFLMRRSYCAVTWWIVLNDRLTRGGRAHAPCNNVLAGYLHAARCFLQKTVKLLRAPEYLRVNFADRAKTVSLMGKNVNSLVE